MTETSSRLLPLLGLLQARRDWPGPELADGSNGRTSGADGDRRRVPGRGGDDNLAWLALRIAMLGVEFEVHEPPELAQHLRELAGRLERATAGR